MTINHRSDWVPTPCHRKTEVFTKPQPGTPATEHAKQLCAECPILKACALDALHAGDSLDGHYTRPAREVIQAGVYCTGDTWTAQQLAAIAGVPTPEYYDHIPRNTPDEACKNCQKPMESWTRGTITPGYVMHYARGYCTDCRGAYNAALGETTLEHESNHHQQRGGLRQKQNHKGDTPNHSVAGAEQKAAAQLSLF